MIVTQSIENKISSTVNLTSVNQKNTNDIQDVNTSLNSENEVISEATEQPSAITNNVGDEKTILGSNTLMTEISERLKLIEEKSDANDRILLIENSINNNVEILGLLNKQIASIQGQLSEINDQKFDEGDEIIITENQEEKTRVGRASEQYLLEYLTEKYGDRLTWLNEKGEQGKSYDFEVLGEEESVIDFFIECKGTKGNSNIFYLTKNEWSFFLNYTSNYRLYFIKNIDKEPIVTEIDNLLTWILDEKVVPYSDKNMVVKKGRVTMMIK